MTDLTTTDINKYHALRKGWTQDDTGLPTDNAGWINPENKHWQLHPPDFCGDRKYAGLLLDEILDSGLKIDIVKTGPNNYQAVVAPPSDPGDFICARGKTPIEAIARASHAMGEEEEK